MKLHRLGLLLLPLWLLGGCAAVTVSNISPERYLAERRGDMLTTGKLSEHAQEVLRVVGLSGCRDTPGTCRNNLSTALGITDEQRLSALSELWLEHALKSARESAADFAAASPDEGMVAADPLLDAWIETARHAYAYLFFTDRRPSERAFEDRQTQVRDYYNYAVQQAVARLFDIAKGSGYQPSARNRIGGWKISSRVVAPQLAGDMPLPDELIVSSSLRFSGLRNTYRRDGFGAELVAVMPGSDSERNAPFQQTHYPTLTALIKFEGRDLASVLRTRTLQVQLYDAYDHSQVALAGEQLPLAANFTAGYGLWLARSGFATQSLRTLFGLQDGIVRPQVQLMQPWDPNRRIVIMLHGLASSPEAWVNVANDIMGDETLRRNFQIWQVYYPTNAPLLLNLHNIRAAVQQTLTHFDPHGHALASRDITLIGHSMGGVLSRLLVSSSGDRLWSVVPEESRSPKMRKLLEREGVASYLNFEPLPQVNRAIFIAAPHQGTPVANHPIARHLANLITLPIAMLGEIGQLGKLLAQGLPGNEQQDAKRSDRSAWRIPNSIDNLSDRDPYVRIAAQLPISPGVRYHSIIGVEDNKTPLADSTDGVVPYRSAHLPGALSERVIGSGHSVQEHPAAIIEIRRILHEQLKTQRPLADQ